MFGDIIQLQRIWRGVTGLLYQVAVAELRIIGVGVERRVDPMRLGAFSIGGRVIQRKQGSAECLLRRVGGQSVWSNRQNQLLTSGL